MKEKVKRLCKQQGKTLKDLAKEMDIKPESLTRALSGNPTLSTIEKIASVLRVEAWELFNSGNKGENVYGVIVVEETPYRVQSVGDLERVLHLVKGTAKKENRS